ncbi:MAG: hypothetical protein Q9219_005955 [cf. Caloplaca sp. 3 TL-2023]
MHLFAGNLRGRELPHRRLRSPAVTSVFREMPKDGVDDSPTYNKPVYSSQGPSLTERVRSLAYPRSGSNSPKKNGNQDAFTIDQESAFKAKTVTNLGTSRLDKDRLRTLRTASGEVHRCSMETINAILEPARTLITLHAKHVCAFLAVVAAHPALDDNTASNVFEMLLRSDDPSCSPEQVMVIDNLTRHGRHDSILQPRLFYFTSELLSNCFKMANTSRADKRSTPSRMAEETALADAMSLLANLVKHDSKGIIDENISIKLLTIFIGICNQTTVESDFRGAIAAIKAIADEAKVPKEMLDSLINALCCISYHKEYVRKETQACLDVTLLKHGQQGAMQLLLHNLSTSLNEQKSTPLFIGALRGALLQLVHIFGNHHDLGIAAPPLIDLVEALQSSATGDHGESSRNQTTLTLTLETAASLIKNDKVVNVLRESDWACMHKVLEQIAKTTKGVHAKNAAYDRITATSPLYQYAHSEEVSRDSVTVEVEQALRRICRGIFDIYPQLSSGKQTLIIHILLFLGKIADPDVLAITVDYMQDYRLAFPPDENWEIHLMLLVDRGLNDKNKHSMFRRRALNLVSDVYETVKDVPAYLVRFGGIFYPLLTGTADESDLAIISGLTEIGSKLLIYADISDFDAVLAKFAELAAMRGTLNLTKPGSGLFEAQRNLTGRHLVGLFLDCLPKQPEKARKLYNSLIAIATNSNALIETRLDVLKLLARLRCDTDGGLKIISMPDMLGLAATLSRTETSANERYGPPVTSNRVSSFEEIPRPRSGRSDVLGHSGRSSSHSRTRSSFEEPAFEHPAVLWLYPGPNALPQDPPAFPSHVLKIHAIEGLSTEFIDLTIWLKFLLETLENGSNWEIYSYILVHLPSQLTNISLYVHHTQQIEALHDLIVNQLKRNKFFDPPVNTGLKRGDVALCLYHILATLVGYSRWFRHQKTTDSTVHTFLVGISMWDRTAKCCIQALALCCHEVPKSVDRCLSLILTKMSQIISQSHLAMDILEFLVRLARLPAAYQSLGEDQLRTIFGICIGHLQCSREKRQVPADPTNPRPGNRLSNISGESFLPIPSDVPTEAANDLSEYVYTLAYHTITHWFLAIPIENRSKHVGWIAKNLAWKDKSGKEIVEELSQVTLDMMHRTAYLDLGETIKPSRHPDDEGHVTKKMWVIGMSIVTIETNWTNGMTYIAKRQASGTTFSNYQPIYAPLPPHHVGSGDEAATAQIHPNHVLLQLNSTISPMPIPTQPIVLPDDVHVNRAISSFDRIDTVDGHKFGVIYIGSGQVEEREILANTKGSNVFNTFLTGLGTKVKLQGARFNTQGLDRESDSDGTHTYAWRDRVTEIVYHVPTMMPTDLEHDPQCTNKKRHTGNDFINIIFNESGLPFQFGTFDSAFNLVNIVISPEKVLVPHSVIPSVNESGSTGSEACYFFLVQVLCDPSLPEISAAATPKMVSASALPSYVRQLAIHASVFCLVWSTRGGGEYVSSWRSRLREIRRLRDRYANTATSANVGYPGMGTATDRGGAKSYVEGDDWKGTHAMGGLAEEGQFLMSLDFTRWT